MAAAATHTPEVALEPDEAAGMAKAIAEVARHYPTSIDPKTLAWVNLIMALAVVYAPRAYLIRERLKAEKAERRGPPPAPTPFEVPVSPPNPEPQYTPAPTQQNASDVPFAHIPGVAFAGLETN